MDNVDGHMLCNVKMQFENVYFYLTTFKWIYKCLKPDLSNLLYNKGTTYMYIHIYCLNIIYQVSFNTAVLQMS